MSDKGEKIVHLARAMLHHQGKAPPILVHNAQHAQEKATTVSFRSATLIAIISAFCGGVVAHFWDESRRPMNKYERVEIEALVFYAAKQNATSQEAVRQDLSQTLAIYDTKEAKAGDFQRMRDYLREKITPTS